jgi:hypothetical protein
MSMAEAHGSKSDTVSDLNLGTPSMTSRLQAQRCKRKSNAASRLAGIVSAADAKRIKYFFIGLRRKQFPPSKKSFWLGANLCTKRHYGRM